MLLISGCLAAPPHEAVRSGPGPFPENCEGLVRDFLKIHLQNPESLKDFAIHKPPEKVAIDSNHPLIPLRKGQQVWETFVLYDEKTDTGEYNGRDLHVVWIRFNRIVAFDYKGTELEYRFEQRMENPGY